MALFGDNESKNLAEIFPPGTPFRLTQAWIQGVAESPMGGVRTLGKVVVSEVENPEVELEFGVWGSLAEQIRRIEAGELPVIVTLDNSAGFWQFAPHGQRGMGTVETIDHEGEVVEEDVPLTAIPEAHLDLDGGESDNPTPVPPMAAPAGTLIDDSHAMKAPPLPTAAPAKPRPIDEAQTFDPRGEGGDTPING